MGIRKPNLADSPNFKATIIVHKTTTAETSQQNKSDSNQHLKVPDLIVKKLIESVQCIMMMD